MSLKFSPYTGTPGRTRAQPRGLLIFLCLLCFPPRRCNSRDRRPQNGSASTGKLHYSNVRCGNRSNGIAAPPASSVLSVSSVVPRFCRFPLTCSRIPPGFPGGTTNDEAFSDRFAVSAGPDPVGLRANEEVTHAEVGRPRS